MTQEKNNVDETAAKKSGLFWMLVPVGLLVTSVSGWLVMVSVAVNDPGFAVEPDYYKKASNYDAVINQREENQRLAYGVEVLSFALASEQGQVGRSQRRSARLILSVRGADGVPLTDARVTADARPVARAFDVQEFSLQHREAGVFEADLERPRQGVWEVRVRVEAGGHVFTSVLRPELSRGLSRSAPGGEEKLPV